MKLCTFLAAAILLTVFGLSKAEAVIWFEDNFETYTDQTVFNTAWTPIGSAAPPDNSNLLTNVPANTGVPITDPSFAPGPSSGANYIFNDASGTKRNQRTFTQTPILNIGDKLIFSLDFYDTSPTLSGNRIHTNLQVSPTSTGTNELLSLGLMNTITGFTNGGNSYMARINGLTSAYVDPNTNPGNFPSTMTDVGWFKFNDFRATQGVGPDIRTQAWHNLKVEISTSNGTSQDYRYYVDDNLAEIVTGVGSHTERYSTIRLGSGLSAAGQHGFWDNIKLEYIAFVPPPSNNADFNDDGSVDAADYVVWKKYNGAVASGSGTQANGDATGDLDVDIDDYNKWFETFGTAPAGSGGGVVPEPSAMVMLLLGMAGFAASRRRG